MSESLPLPFLLVAEMHDNIHPVNRERHDPYLTNQPTPGESIKSNRLCQQLQSINKTKPGRINHLDPVPDPVVTVFFLPSMNPTNPFAVAVAAAVVEPAPDPEPAVGRRPRSRSRSLAPAEIEGEDFCLIRPNARPRLARLRRLLNPGLRFPFSSTRVALLSTVYTLSASASTSERILRLDMDSMDGEAACFSWLRRMCPVVIVVLVEPDRVRLKVGGE